MPKDLMKKIALLEEVARQNRIIELRLKYEKTKEGRLKQEFKKMMENLIKQEN